MEFFEVTNQTNFKRIPEYLSDKIPEKKYMPIKHIIKTFINQKYLQPSEIFDELISKHINNTKLFRNRRKKRQRRKLPVENTDQYLKIFCTDNVEHIPEHKKKRTHLNQIINTKKITGKPTQIEREPKASYIESLAKEIMKFQDKTDNEEEGLQQLEKCIDKIYRRQKKAENIVKEETSRLSKLMEQLKILKKKPVASKKPDLLKLESIK